jgi:hypothetical protein
VWQAALAPLLMCRELGKLRWRRFMMCGELGKLRWRRFDG